MHTIAPVPAPRFTLRQLPLPAKLVVTLFLLTVGLGYFSALVQMHFQHTPGDGSPMPGVSDVIEIFAGKRKITVEEARAMRPKSKLESVVTGSREVFTSSSMAAAFFHKDPSKEWDKLIDKRNPDPQVRAQVEADREGERKIVHLWIMTPDAERKAAYEADNFKPAKDAPAVVTEKFVHNKAAIADGVKVKSILTARCAECHQEGGTKSEFPLDTYTGLAKYLEVAPGIEIPEGATEVWCVSSRQISREKLAQSTHAHLLSFAMLFSLTGLAFAFTGYPAFIRFLIAPIVLLAQVADVSCWWLARIDGPGIYFAQAIMGTGAIVGLGLALQIVLSVFSMYGAKGKIVLVTMFLGAAAGGGLVAEKYAKPFLADLKAKKEKADAEANKPKVPALPVAPAPEPAGKKVDKKDKDPIPPAPMMMSPSLEKLLIASDWQKAPWGLDKAAGRVPDGGMARAFFDKSDSEFKDAAKAKNDDPEAYKTILSQRTGELTVVLAWLKAKPDDRKKSFEKDEFPLPLELKGKPLTAEFIANDKAVKIKSIFETRCMKCHSEADKVQLDTFEKLEKFLK